MSSINPNNIDGTYPIARQDNDSQGFRDNFTNIKNNFTFAQSEINDLQSKVLLKSALAGESLNNDMANSQFLNAQMIGTSQTLNNIGSISGAVDISFASGHFQYMTTTGTVSLTFSDWVTSGFYAQMRLLINVVDTSHTITLPAACDVGVDRIAAATGQVLTYGTGTVQLLEFSTYDSGTSIIARDLLN